MSTFLRILLNGLAASAIALVASVALLGGEERPGRILLPLVAFAAGTLLGGAFFHLLPTSAGSLAPLSADVTLLPPLAAGHSIGIAAAGHVPEIGRREPGRCVHLLAFAFGSAPPCPVAARPG